MNYYIDFDNTLYETSKLTILTLNKIVEMVLGNNIENKEERKAIIEGFNSTKGNLFTYAEEIANKYKANPKQVVESIKELIENTRELTYKDGESFLKKLKENGHKLILLTYIPSDKNQEFQMSKIIGSGLKEYFDEILITSEYKFTIDIDYKSGIFIDDNPRDLNGLYERNPIKVIKIRKKENKYSLIDISNKEIEEHEFFDEIQI